MLQMDLPEWMLMTYVFVIGTVLGSFLNVCVHRIPQNNGLRRQLQSLWKRPSHCPRCDTNIRWYDNLPIIGWLKLRGRCRNCGMWISPRYPIVEFLNGIVLVILFWYEVPLGMRASLEASSIYSPIGPQAVPGLGAISPEVFVWARFLFHALLVEALLAASLIDLDLRIIPEATTEPGTVLAILAMVAFPFLHIVPVWFQQAGLLRTFGIIVPTWLHPFLDDASMQMVNQFAVPNWIFTHPYVGSSRVDLQACKLEYSIVSPK